MTINYSFELVLKIILVELEIELLVIYNLNYLSTNLFVNA